MLRRSLLVLSAMGGLLAGCEHKDVLPSQMSVSEAAEFFDRPSDVEVKLNQAALRAIESGLSLPAVGTQVSFAGGISRKPLTDDGCTGNADACLELILNNARAPYPELMELWAEKLVAMPNPASGGNAAEAASETAYGDTLVADFYFKLAAQHYSKALDQTPADLELWTKLVRVQIQLDEVRNAVGSSEKAVQANPRAYHAWLLLADAHAANQELDRAVDSLLVAHLLAPDQAAATKDFQELAANEMTPLRPAAVEALTLLDRKAPADSYESMCHPSSPAVLKTCEGATINGVARYESGDGVNYPVRLTIGDTNYYITSPGKLTARQGQLIRFAAAVGSEGGKFTQGRFEVLPFAGSARDKLAWDALQFVVECASANSELIPSLFDPHEKMEALREVRIDAAHPANGSVVLTTQRQEVDYFYRCGFKDGKLAALQAHEVAEGGKFKWEPMAVLKKRRADASAAAEQVAEAEEKAHAAAELNDPRFIRAGRLLLAANRGVGQAMSYDHMAYEGNKFGIEHAQHEMNSALKNGTTEYKIQKIVAFATEARLLCDIANAPCTELRQQLDGL